MVKGTHASIECRRPGKLALQVELWAGKLAPLLPFCVPFSRELERSSDVDLWRVDPVPPVGRGEVLPTLILVA